MDQEKLMKQIQPGSQHVVVAGRADGAVGFLYTRDPLNWLAYIGTHAQLEDVEVRASAQAVRIVNHLRSRFTILQVPSGASVWHLVDFPQAVAALEEMDLATGEPRTGFALNAEVMVLPERNRGRIFGFTRGGDVVVKLQAPAAVTRLTIARRENLRLVVRVPVGVTQ